DRGIVLAGLLTEAQLAEIHTVGDLWRQHHRTFERAVKRGAKAADTALARIRRERAERKAEKQRLAAERDRQRAADVARRRREDIVFLGRSVSGSLGQRTSDVDALARAGVPVLATPADVAAALGLTIARLRWLCFHTEAAERTHYVYFDVP